VDPLTEWACGKVLWILLPKGLTNSCDKGCIREGTLRNNDVLHGSKYCLFQHLAHIAMGHFITYTFNAGTFCSCIVIKDHDRMRLLRRSDVFILGSYSWRNPDAKYGVMSTVALIIMIKKFAVLNT
jgi:hypothetical protein